MSQTIKLTQPGWETYNGHLSEIEFVNGVSVGPATKIQIQRIAGCIAVETLDGLDPSEGAAHIAIVKGEQPPVIFDEDKQIAATPIIYDFTRESLEAIADKQGLAGLRPIGDQYGVKSNSIVSMIDKLMSLTGEVKI